MNVFTLYERYYYSETALQRMKGTVNYTTSDYITPKVEMSKFFFNIKKV